MFNKELLMAGEGGGVSSVVRDSYFVLLYLGSSYKNVDFYSPLANLLNFRVLNSSYELSFTLLRFPDTFAFSDFLGATYKRVGGDSTLIIKAVEHNQLTLYARYSFGPCPAGKYTFVGINVFDEI